MKRISVLLRALFFLLATAGSLAYGRGVEAPPGLREGVPENDMVHFVLEAVEAIPQSSFEVNCGGTGSVQYRPAYASRTSRLLLQPGGIFLAPH